MKTEQKEILFAFEFYFFCCQYQNSNISDTTTKKNKSCCDQVKVVLLWLGKLRKGEKNNKT